MKRIYKILGFIVVLLLIISAWFYWVYSPLKELKSDEIKAITITVLPSPPTVKKIMSVEGIQAFVTDFNSRNLTPKFNLKNEAGWSMAIDIEFKKSKAKSQIQLIGRKHENQAVIVNGRYYKTKDDVLSKMEDLLARYTK